MGRWPAPSRCKSRLARGGLGPEPAARVQQRLWAHTLAVLSSSCRTLPAQGRLALSGCGARAARRWLAPLAPGTLQVGLQGRGGLGERMQRQLMAAFARGYRQVVVIGSDLPGLQGDDLQQAFSALEHSRLVLGPADDGGYWLVGLSSPAAALFAGVGWGSDQVLQQTLARAAAAGLTPALLRRQGDLDRVADLGRWR